MNIETLTKLAEAQGFSHMSPLNTNALVFRPDVRAICETGRCGGYGKSWTCPPHCGSLEEIRLRAAAYPEGLLLQQTGQMEDDFDYECMQNTEKLFKQKLYALCD